MQYTIQDINKKFKNSLNSIYSSSEIQQILFLVYEKVLSVTKIFILTNQNTLVDRDKYEHIDLILNQLLCNKPIQYILGETYFFDLKFEVNSSVLIPRPETEELVHWIIDVNRNKKVTILDMGTGSGCIAIALSKEIDKAQVYAVDISQEAIDVASKNAVNNNFKIEFIKFDILEDNPLLLPQNIDILVSNPPYIKNSERKIMKNNVLDYEPKLALFVNDEDPLIFYIKIAEIGKKILKKGGHLFFEINEKLAYEVKEMLEKKEYYNIEIKKDINNKNRMVRAILL